MKLLYTVLLVALSSAVFAQSNYHEGYVLKNSGDTLKGFINYREWAQCPLSIDFKINKDDKQALKFNPHTIKEFQINGMGTYFTYKGVISMDRTKFPDLPLTLDTNKKQDTIFLKQVSKGQYLTVFYHEDAVKTRFFIAETGALPVELKYAQYYITNDQVHINDEYKKQLAFYAGKYAPGNSILSQKIENCAFNESDIEKIISLINGNTSVTKTKAIFRFFVGGGLNKTTTHLQDDEERIAVQVTEFTITNTVINRQSISKYSTTPAPRLNLGVDLFTNPDVQKLVFRAELSLSYANPRFDYTVYYQPDDSNITATTSFSQYSATLTPQLIFNFYNSTSFKAYVDLGLGLNFSVYNNTKIYNATKSDLKSYWTNLPVQLGIVLNKNIELSVSYTGYVDYTSFAEGYGIRSQTMGFGVRYLF